MAAARTHGGPGAGGAAPHDFSANANGCGPCPSALAAVRQADPTRYPDPASTALREALAALHGVAAARIVVAASASEFIMRITAAAARPGGAVLVPPHAYGDYAWAARAHGLAVRQAPAADCCLAWACDPSSPLGQAPPDLHAQADALAARLPLVLDCAYAPLRLAGRPALPPGAGSRVWQLWSPNKALGLTGVRGAYAVAPADADPAWLDRLQALAPSWPLGAHGVAMLQAWAGPEAQAWVRDSLPQLRTWKARLAALCEAQGWRVLPGDAHFFCARLPGGCDPAGLLQALRTHGVQLRDCASFGLPGHVRLAVLAPGHQDALAAALQALGSGTMRRQRQRGADVPPVHHPRDRA
ncbi:aminotransferase class I/II-fold pyridoxal phosphate-dependent enzyme [Pseudorhodoferax sp.]|uniref:aminotransferase class I/II-fold pyridoxal phosphate-dependent enzyme n=1 Tax=Pseudorhodoferax sp. TaxID=1993553 RepID=UPI0039E534D3